MAMKKHDREQVSFWMKQRGDGTLSTHMEGSATNMRDIVERFGRGVGYGQEMARQHGALRASSTKAIEAPNYGKCSRCSRSIDRSNEMYYCKCFASKSLTG